MAMWVMALFQKKKSEFHPNYLKNGTQCSAKVIVGVELKIFNGLQKFIMTYIFHSFSKLIFLDI